MTAKCSSYMIRNGEVRNRGIRGAFGLITNFRRDRMRLYAGVSPRLILKTRLLMLIASFASLITTHDAIGAPLALAGQQFRNAIPTEDASRVGIAFLLAGTGRWITGSTLVVDGDIWFD